MAMSNLDLCAHGGRRRNTSDPVNLRRRKVRPLQLDTRPDDNGSVGWTKVQHVQRFRSRDAEPLPLTDREAMDTAVMSKDISGLVDDGAAWVDSRGMPFDERCVVATGHETNLLTIRLVSNG